MIKFLKSDIALVLYLILLFIFIGYLSVQNEKSIYYEYTDLDGNKGTTSSWTGCFYEGYYSMGSPMCELDDGTILAVKSYKEISR
jgi:hypothetical protein